MARNKANQQNIDNSNPSLYPDARIRDNDGSGNGTPVNESVYGDIHEFFAAAMRLAGIDFNGLPDNLSNGYQYIEAMRNLASKNDILITITSEIVGSQRRILAQGLDTRLLRPKEMLFAVAPFDRDNNLQFNGTVAGSSNKALVGDNFSQGDLIVFIAETIDGNDNSPSQYLVRNLVTENNLESLSLGFGFLKAATQTQENSGASNTVSTTPQTNFTAFQRRVTGADSLNHLATSIRNGLYPMSHFSFLADLIANGIQGTPLISGSFNIGNIVSPSNPTGDITNVNRVFPAGSSSAPFGIYQVNFNTVNTSDYTPVITILSNRVNSTVFTDNVNVIVADRTPTSFRIRVRELGGGEEKNISILLKVLPN